MRKGNPCATFKEKGILPRGDGARALASPEKLDRNTLVI
jgi:hypothetical protein